MANGDYLPPEELRHFSEPINRIKKDLDTFAQQNGLELLYHRRGWVSAEMGWSNSFALNCQIYLSMNEDRSTFELGLEVSKRVGEDLYWKVIELQKNIRPPFDPEALVDEMKRGLKLCNSLMIDDLELAPK